MSVLSELEIPLAGDTSQGALEDFARHSRGRSTTSCARRSFVRDVQISVLVATWTVILSLPVIIWPWAEYMNHTWCRQLDLAHCVKDDDPSPVCKVTWSWGGWVHCVPARPSAFLNLWGTMLLQFIFSVYVDLGTTVKFTLQGLFGTSLAYLNVMFLNKVLGFMLAGGAYAHSLQVDSGQGESFVISKWLPLCNTGVRRIADAGAFCFLNVWTNKMSWLGTLSFTVISVDFVLFVFLCLSLGFNTNPRIFALSTHVSFMMTFVDPSGDSFSTEPTYATEYLEMIGLASFMALACFFVPRRRFTATEAAETWALEALAVTKVLVKHLPESLDEVLRLKARTCLETAEKHLQELRGSVGAARFERFAWFWRQQQHQERLERLPARLQRCLQRLPGVFQAAESLEPVGLSEELRESLQRCCEAYALKLDGLMGEAAATEAAAQAEQKLAERWREDQERRPEVSAFLLVVCGLLAEIDEALAADPVAEPPQNCWLRLKTFAKAILFHNDDFEGTHPRFVVRNTISICLAFGIGWLGLWNVMPSYSSYAASTIAVIAYTFTGATPSVTVRRLSGVVLGKVAGSILQLALAVKHVLYVIAFAFSMWLVVTFTFFQYLHARSELASVYGLTAAYAAASMIPASGVLRDYGDNTQASVLPTLMNTVVQTVLGIGIMLLVDTALASRATKQARQRLGRACERLNHCFALRGDPQELEICRSSLVKDLDALKALLPHAAAEPVYWSKPFQLELFTQLEASLRRVAEHIGMLCWLMNFASPVLSLKSWPPLHGCWHAQVSQTWLEISGICRTIVEGDQGEERLEEILNELATNLYTFQVANKVAERVPELKLPRAPRGLRRIFHQVLHEGIDAATPPAAAEAASHAMEEMDLESCIRIAREEALELPQTTPRESALCAVDTAAQLMRSSLEDLRKMQLALLEF